MMKYSRSVLGCCLKVGTVGFKKMEAVMYSGSGTNLKVGAPLRSESGGGTDQAPRR